MDSVVRGHVVTGLCAGGAELPARIDLQPGRTSIALGLTGALALTRLMAGLLYEVRPHDALTFVAVSAGLALVVLLAGLVPAWRATRVDPILALRME
jgi:ABC-type lipoprotein release transport system permease subunit